MALPEQGLTAIGGSCLTLSNDGIITWYGYESANFGTATPDEVQGQHLYSFKYKATGEFLITFGAAGNEKLGTIDNLYIKSADSAYSRVLVWSATDSAYIDTDLDSATFLVGESDICLSFYELPEDVIHYTYETIQTIKG